jgi:hypothetical protein
MNVKIQSTIFHVGMMSYDCGPISTNGRDRYGPALSTHIIVCSVVDRRANIAMAIGMMIYDRTGTPLAVPISMERS